MEPQRKLKTRPLQAEGIVYVNCAVPPYEWRPEYIILRDKTCNEVMATARRNPGVWIFPFATGAVEDAPDYRWIRKRRDPAYELVTAPWYLGNFAREDIEPLIRRIVVACLGASAMERTP